MPVAGRSRRRQWQELIVAAFPLGIIVVLLVQLYLVSVISRSGYGLDRSIPSHVSNTKKLGHRHGPLNLVFHEYHDDGPTPSPKHKLQLQPKTFQCYDEPKFRRTKMVFVHVFKTAGSTIRNFFDAYTNYCYAGWAIIVGCATVDVNTIGTKQHAVKWNATHPLPGEPLCSMKRTWNRTLSIRYKVDVENEYVAKDLDIIGGHLPLGIESVWKNTEHLSPQVQDEINVQYLTFVRNAVDKLVSGTSYKTANATVNGVVEKIRSDVESSLVDNRFQSKYAEYYITPMQKETFRKSKIVLSAEESVVEQMANLLEYNVLVGATERMSDSLHLLQSVIDENGDAEEIFEEFGMDKKASKKTVAETDNARPRVPKQGNTTTLSKGGNKAPLIINPSDLSTRSIVRQLKKDEMLFLDVLEFVRYEQQVSDFALAMHMNQYRQLSSHENLDDDW